MKQVVKQYGFDGLIVEVRRDEEGSRSKERVFSERNESDAWDYTNQPPTVGERSGRAQDNEDSYALQKLRREGYM